MVGDQQRLLFGYLTDIRADAFLASIIDMIPSKNYTVLYATTASSTFHKSSAPEANEYEMEGPLQDAMHVDLKRDVETRSLRSRNNQTMVDGPLFEKYQFLSPGKFS